MVRIGTNYSLAASAPAPAPAPFRAPAPFQVPSKFKQVLYNEGNDVSLPTQLDIIPFKKPMSQKEAKAAAAKAKAAAPKEVKEYYRIEKSTKPEIKGKGKGNGKPAASKPAKVETKATKVETEAPKVEIEAPTAEAKGESAPSKPAKAAPVQEDGWTLVRH